MNATTSAIATPLSWLKAEMDRSLALARTALARALLHEPGQRDASLEACAQPMRHIRGALQMLDLQGAARFSGAVEEALQRFGTDATRLNPMTVSVLDRALFALSQFLDDLAKGEADVPLKLFPVYCELGELCERNGVTESELFFPDLAAVPARARCAERLEPERRERYVASWRAHFQRGLLAWLKHPHDAQALQTMRATLEALDQVADQLATPPGFWWVGAGLVDSLLHTDVHAERMALKPLLIRIERLMRCVAAGVASDADGLMRDMLYAIALAAPMCARVCDIKSVYKLAAQLPEFCLSGTLEYDVCALAPVLDQMRQKLVAMQEAWARYADGSADDLKRLRAQAGALKAVARDLGHYRMVRVLDIVTLIASKLSDADPATNDVLALEMAAALLFMEGMLDHFTSPPTDIDQQVAVMVGWLLDAVKPQGSTALGTGAPRDDITQRQHYTEVRAQVAREILANLMTVEQALEGIVRDADACSRIAALDAPMRQIAGALKMLGLSRATGVHSACAHLMKLSVCDDEALTRASLEWVADGLSCLGFYLENVCHGETPNEEMLLGFVQRLSRDDAHPAGSTGWIPAAIAQPEAALTPAREPAAVMHAAAVPDGSAAQIGASEAQDLRAGYIEEARGILAALERLLSHLRVEPDDRAALTEARRSFHTLKGGARLVHLELAGELAWEVERTLNAFVQAQRPASDEILVLIGEAVETLITMIDALGIGFEPDVDARARIIELAVALRESGEPATPNPAGPQAETEPSAASDAEEPEVAIGELRLSQTLYRIFRDESEALLETVRTELAELARQPAASVSAALLRAAHTLRSTSTTLGFEPVAVLASALEELLQQLPAGPAPRQWVAALDAALAALCRMFAAIREGRPPRHDTRAAQALRALAARCEPSQAAAGAADATSQRPDARLAPLFLHEAGELLARITAELALWRRRPAGVESARAIARALHTLKGSARMTGATHAGELVHALESRIGMVIDSGQPGEPFFSEVASTLEQIARSIQVPAAFDSAAANTAWNDVPPALMPARFDASQPQELQAAAQLSVEAETLDALVDQAGEISIVRFRIENELEGVRLSLHDLTDSVARLRTLLRDTQVEADSQLQARSARQGGHDSGFDPLELDRYTRLQELTRMMAESLHDVQLIQQTLLADTAETEAALSLQARVARDLQRSLVELRSLPFGALRERLQRTLSHTAQALGCSAELHVEGGEIELDRSILQRLVAPLEHMLRNALAHGIETASVRAALGKPPTGRVRLQLRRQGLDIILVLADDGSGLDRERIRHAAVGLGLLDPADSPSESALHELIFAPGLSTASRLTESAGRGVGLDVVRTEIAALGGSIAVVSAPGVGTSFRIRLPLSLAAAQVLLLRAAGSTYAVPSDLVEGVEELAPAALQRAYAEGVLAIGSAQYPLYRLPRLLDQEEDAAGVGRRNAVLLLRSGEQCMALHIDAIVRTQEAVLKPLGPQLARVPGLAGVIVLGNDQIVLVIDPLRCIADARSARIHARLAAARSAALPPDPLHVMVVDDSLTVRRLTGRLLSRAGYEVSAAKDGLDALQQMQRGLPDLVVLDLEMPRMDGFELARQLRADPRTAPVPIVIVTSRLAEKHQRRAAEMGANAFFGKPYPEDELLACIGGLLGTRSAAWAA